MSAGDCGEASAVGGMAEELFHLASLLVGASGHALPVIEQALATVEIDPCLDPVEAKQQARRAVVRTAIAQLTAEHPAAFAGAADVEHGPGPCVHDADLQAAGVTAEDLQTWLGAQGGAALESPARVWLEGLPTAERAVFVQRAVLGQGNEAAASLLREAAGADGWTGERVAGVFRRALCSLADALAHAPVPSMAPA